MADCVETDAWPVLLVSAAEHAAAVNLINEIAKDSQLDQTENLNKYQYLWTIKNKYYEAKISICISTDEKPVFCLSPDAHVIFIQDSKGEGVKQAEARSAAICGGRVRDDGVLLAVCEASPAPPALAAWARTRRYELVELQESAPLDAADEPIPEQYGVQRAVCALHAHVWPGLRRVDRLGMAAPSAPALSGHHYDEEQQLERAEEFAELLGRLDAARDSLVAHTSDDERRARAEHLVGAFCRALGLEPDAL